MEAQFKSSENRLETHLTIRIERSLHGVHVGLVELQFDHLIIQLILQVAQQKVAVRNAVAVMLQLKTAQQIAVLQSNVVQNLNV